LTLNGNRKVVGTLRGFDAFLNVVLEEAVDEKPIAANGGQDQQVYIGQIVIRGNSISQFETLERVKA
jgi:Small nuclear ribonucleoprotein (snRNP) homolog